MATLRVIESIEGHRSTQVTTYLSGTDRVELQTHTECFWDVVGDIVLSTTIEQLNGGKNEGGLCCLVPTPCLPEGRYYSPGVLRNLFRRVASCENWEYWLFRDPGHQFDYGIPTFSASDWSAALGKEIQQKMSNSTQLPSFAEYKKNFAPQAESTVTPLKGSLPSLAEYSRESATVTAISPFAEGNGAAVSYEARLKSLAFAHPVDQTIIKALDNAAVNAVFNKVVQTSIDANYGLTLATGIHVSQNTYSQIYEVVLECAQSLGIPVPYVIISDSVRGLNACTAGTDQFAFIAISSMLPMVLKREELKFVIGHECGHLALGHVVYHTATSMMGAMGGLLPLVGPIIAKTISYPLNAWSRRSEISADRAGLICCQDITVAKRALFRLCAGLLNTEEVDIDEYVQESERVLNNTSIGKFAEFELEHPIIPKRIKALDLFSRSEVYAKSIGVVPASGYISAAQLTRETEKIIEIM